VFAAGAGTPYTGGGGLALEQSVDAPEVLGTVDVDPRPASPVNVLPVGRGAGMNGRSYENVVASFLVAGDKREDALQPVWGSARAAGQEVPGPPARVDQQVAFAVTVACGDLD
jgi:hypothetical protein